MKKGWRERDWKTGGEGTEGERRERSEGMERKVDLEGKRGIGRGKRNGS